MFNNRSKTITAKMKKNEAINNLKKNYDNKVKKVPRAVKECGV